MSGAMNDKWLWKTTETEKSFFEFSLCYELILATSTPVTLDEFNQALLHLFRKVPNLRVCFKERNGDIWTKEMDEEKVDFKIVPASMDTNDLHNAVVNKRYDLDHGPLWFVKLRPNPGSEGAEEGDTKPGFPHVSTVFLGFHHGITDGTSNMKICGWLAHLLDDVMAGRPVDDHVQLGTFVSPLHTEQMVELRAKALHEDPERKATIMAVKERHRDTVTLLERVFPPAEDGQSHTLVKELDAATTSAFIKKCKAEGVTVNSGFVTLVTKAMVELISDNGLVMDSYPVNSVHFLSTRRYWQHLDHRNPLGCHTLDITLEVSLAPDAHFWDLARTIHQAIRDQVQNGDAFEGRAVKAILDTQLEHPDSITNFPNYNFGVSNMGDVTADVACDGEHVWVRRVLRTVKIPKNWGHLVHTLHGRLIHVMAYNTCHVTHALARDYLATTYRMLNDVL